MNNIKNYGMTNYQIGFQARNAKKAVKGLKPISEWVTKDGKKILEMNDAVVDKQYKPSIQQFKTVKQNEPFASYYQEHSNGELSELANQIPSVKIKMLIESFNSKVLSALGL